MKLSLSLVSIIAFVYCVFAKISIGAFSNEIMFVKDRFGIVRSLSTLPQQ